VKEAPIGMSKLKAMGWKMRIFNQELKTQYLALLQRGIPQVEALTVVGVSEATLIRERKRDAEFEIKERTARTFTLHKARMVIHEDIVDKKNVNTSKWYLDREVYDKEKQNNNTVNFFTQVNNVVTEDRSKFVEGETINVQNDNTEV